MRVLSLLNLVLARSDSYYRYDGCCCFFFVGHVLDTAPNAFKYMYYRYTNGDLLSASEHAIQRLDDDWDPYHALTRRKPWGTMKYSFWLASAEKGERERRRSSRVQSRDSISRDRDRDSGSEIVARGERDCSRERRTAS